MRQLPLLSLLLAWLALAAPAGADALTETLPVAGPGRLVIELDRGSVDVVTHTLPNVHVNAEARGLGANGVHFEVVREGRDVVLRARTEEWIDWLSSGPRLAVQVEVPASFEVVCASAHTLVTRRDAVEISYPTRAIGNATR